MRRARQRTVLNFLSFPLQNAMKARQTFCRRELQHGAQQRDSSVNKRQMRQPVYVKGYHLLSVGVQCILFWCCKSSGSCCENADRDMSFTTSRATVTRNGISNCGLSETL